MLNEVIYECQRSLEGIEHAKLDLEARSWARAQGLRGVSGRESERQGAPAQGKHDPCDLVRQPQPCLPALAQRP